MAVYRSEIEGADERTHAIVLIRVERVLSLTSPGYDIGASEDEMRARWERHWDALRAASRSGR